jgi:hypothetical protein
MRPRQKARQERKLAKVQSRETVKLAKIAKKQEGQQARIAKRSDKKQAIQARKAAKNTRVAAMTEMQNNLPADLTPENVPLKAKVKATNYLKTRGRVIEDENDAEMLGAQFLEERQRQIAERHDEIENAIDDTQGLTEDERDELVPEYEDVLEEIMEEEENNFAFDGNEDFFVDPATAAMLINVGKAGAEKYKEKRFKAGKKAFGRTAAQDKAIKEKKAGGEATASPASAALSAAITEVENIKTKEAIKSYTPYFIGGGVLLVIIGVAVFYAGKKS